MSDEEDAMSDEHAEFTRGDRRSYVEEVEPWGSVEVEAADEFVRCYANVGGWEWQAEGQDRMQAARRLTDRIRHLNPFDGLDWGPPGHQTGPLSTAIPARIRELMIAYQQSVDPNIPDEWVEGPAR